MNFFALHLTGYGESDTSGFKQWASFYDSACLKFPALSGNADLQNNLKAEFSRLLLPAAPALFHRLRDNSPGIARFRQPEGA